MAANVDWTLWLATMVPLIFSAGPGNLMVAASGARSGILPSMGFIFGLDGTYFLLALIMGFGLGQILLNFPSITLAIKVLGISYIFYLSYKFLNARIAAELNDKGAFRFKDGAIVQLTNTKGLLMLVVMFSEFFKPSATLIWDVFAMSFILVLLNFSAHLIWVSLGAVIKHILIRNPSLYRVQNYLFGAMMAGVGTWLILR